jgi:transposase
MKHYSSKSPEDQFKLNILIAMISLFFSCNGATTANNKQEEVTAKPKSVIIKKPPSSFKDTLVISSKSAVFYQPDSLQLEKIKTVNEKTTYSIIAHDCYFQMRNAREVLKEYWPSIKIIETSRAKYLLFIKEDQSRVCIDLNEKNDICGVFIFDKKKNPVLVDMPNIATVLGFYFNR